MITITLKIEEKPKGNLSVDIKACDIGTMKEAGMAKAIIEASEYATQWFVEQTGGKFSKCSNPVEIIKPVGGE